MNGATLENDSTGTLSTGLDELLRQENLLLHRQIENIQSQLAESVSSGADKVFSSQQVESNCEMLSSESASIQADTEQLSRAVSEMRTLVEETDRKLMGIRKFVELIEEVASSTRLLALNATIEAAHAGAAGKGFAVVAGEVKNLSGKTHEAAERIGDTVKEILANSTQVAEKMRSLEERSEHMRDIIAEFNEQIRETNEQSLSAVSRINGINDHVVVSLAKLDYLLANVDAYTSIANGTPTASPVDLEECQLTKWYQTSSGQSVPAGLPSFRDLSLRHDRIRQATKKILSLAHEGRPADELSVTSALTEMEHCSDAVFEHLDRVLAEKSEFSPSRQLDRFSIGASSPRAGIRY